MNDRHVSSDFHSLRIIVAEQRPEPHGSCATILPRLGHKLVHVAKTGRELIEKCRELQPDLVISDFQLPDMDADKAEQAISEERPCPFIVRTAEGRREQIGRSAGSRILAYLVDPVQAAQLEVQIPLVMRWFEQMESLRQEIVAHGNCAPPLAD